MKYIRSREIFESDFAQADAIELQNDYTGLSKEELKALLDQAVADEDWDKVKKIGQLAQTVSENRLNQITHFNNFVQLDETVQMAKQILQKLADKEIEKRTPEIERAANDLPEEEREENINSRKQEIIDAWLKNPDYIEIRDTLSSKNPNWVGAFIKFRFVQGASLATVLSLYRTALELKDLIKELPHTIDEYSTMVPTKDDSTPGYEKLGDDFNRLMELRRGKWIVQALPTKGMSTPAHAAAGFSPVNLREIFKAASKEKQMEIIKAASDLNDLNKPALIKAVTAKLSGLPDLDSLLEYIKLQINNAGSDRGKIIETAISAYPSVTIMYEGADHVVFSFRNDSQLPFLCAKATGWCIQPAWYNKGYADRFWSYADGSLQLGILDFSVDSSDPYHTVGVTIEPNRNVKSLCNQPNHCTSGRDFETMFKGFNCSGDQHSYPQELIDAVAFNFDQEVKLKRESDAIYKKIKQFSEGERDYDQAVIKTVTGMISNLAELTKAQTLTQNDLSANSSQNIAKQIVVAELSNLKNSAAIESVREKYIDTAKTAGISSPADVKIFEMIMQDSPKYTKDFISTIIARNNLILKVLVENTKKADRTRAERFILIAESIKQATDLLEGIKATLK